MCNFLCLFQTQILRFIIYFFNLYDLDWNGPLAVPRRVFVRKVREVAGGRGRLRPVVAGVDVDERRGAARAGVEHLAHALHRAAVEVDPVVVDAINHY